jgi:uncharacterized protein (DUF2235 family)
MKKIAIFCDGTWNTPDEEKDGKLCQTNVVKMANALSTHSRDGKIQLLYYDTGIGSAGSINKRIFDGATGSGISEKILQAYRFLINNYEPGDELYFFGFSRGAFTVRSLSGLIRNSGILKKDNLSLIDKAYSLYHSRKPMHNPHEVESVLFRKTFSVEESTIIHFIGVWDTVGALGNPLYLHSLLSRKNEFHDTDLSTRIRYAFHALAIDEKRKNFNATLWHQQENAGKQVLEQVWFAGVHSDVGGGFPESESGLSDISLQWMLGKAESCNLSFEKILLKPDLMTQMHESYKGFYKLQPKLYRPIGTVTPGKGNTNEYVHPSVIEKYRKDSTYKPPNLKEYFSRHPL